MDNENIFAVVVDLETTGLSAELDVPLELGINVIDKEGYSFGSASWLIYEPDDENFMASVDRGHKNPFVNAMHTESGLWADLEAHGNLSRAYVAEQAVEFLKDLGIEPLKVPMMGNSIGSLDRPFSITHLPAFHEHLSYRNIDISTVKEICKAVNPTLFENLRPIIGDKKDATHRVLDDIEACITEYRAYCANFFFIED